MAVTYEIGRKVMKVYTSRGANIRGTSTATRYLVIELDPWSARTVDLTNTLLLTGPQDPIPPTRHLRHPDRDVRRLFPLFIELAQDESTSDTDVCIPRPPQSEAPSWSRDDDPSDFSITETDDFTVNAVETHGTPVCEP